MTKTLFFFPHRVNVLVTRLVAFQTFIVTLLLLIFGQGSGTPGQTGHWWWVPAALAIDTALRFIGFPNLQKLIATLVLRFSREFIAHGDAKWGAEVTGGAPKQFSTFVSFLCTFLAQLIYRIQTDPSESEEGREVVAKIFIGMVCFFSLLDWTTGFCFACFIFNTYMSLAKKFAKPAAQAGEGSSGDVEAGAAEHKHGDGETHHHHGSQDFHSGAAKRPLTKESIKPRTIEMKLADADGNFSLIKHFDPIHLACPVGLAGVALMWRATSSPGNALSTPVAVWHVLAYAAAVVFGFNMILLILKAAWYPNKMLRHWDNPNEFNAFGFAPITGIVLAVLLRNFISQSAFSVLIWCCAGVQLAFTIASVGRFFSNFRSLSVINAGLMVGPLGLLVSSMGLSDLTDPNWTMVSPDGTYEAAALWYYPGAFFWFVLQPWCCWRPSPTPAATPRRTTLTGCTWLRRLCSVWRPFCVARARLR